MRRPMSPTGRHSWAPGGTAQPTGTGLAPPQRHRHPVSSQRSADGGWKVYPLPGSVLRKPWKLQNHQPYECRVSQKQVGVAGQGEWLHRPHIRCFSWPDPLSGDRLGRGHVPAHTSTAKVRSVPSALSSSTSPVLLDSQRAGEGVRI